MKLNKGKEITTYEEFMENDYTHIRGEIYDDFDEPIKVIHFEKDIFRDKEHFDEFLKSMAKREGYKFFFATEIDESIINKKDDLFLRNILEDYIDSDMAIERIITEIRDHFKLGGK